MKYTCKECGWIRENKEGHWTDEEDYKAIFDHEKERHMGCLLLLSLELYHKVLSFDFYC